MKLLTKAIAKSLPKLGATEGKDAEVKVKFFTPWSSWTWFATEGSAVTEDGEVALSEVPKGKQVTDVTFYGLVEGHERELGCFSLNELEAIRGPWGLKVERDLYFGKHKLSEV